MSLQGRVIRTCMSSRKRLKTSNNNTIEDSDIQKDNLNIQVNFVLRRSIRQQGQRIVIGSDTKAHDFDQENSNDLEQDQLSNRRRKPKKFQDQLDNNHKKIKNIKEDNMTFIPRVINQVKFLGAHVSAAGGVHKAIDHATRIGANAFAIFLKSQRRWVSPPLLSSVVNSFKLDCGYHSYDPMKHVVPHGSYLINLATHDKELRKKCQDCLLDDLKRCEELGIRLYNLHPGSTRNEITVEEGCKNIAECINEAHNLTKNVIVLLENMAGAGSVIGSKFEELAMIINHIKNKHRIGICVDTCHMFAAGYDIRCKESYKSSMAEIEKYGLISYVRAWHFNDSLEELGSKRDRHANIGHGHIGLEGFRLLMNDSRLDGMPLILETPCGDENKSGTHLEVWNKEIKALYSLVGRSETDNLEDIRSMLSDTMIKTKNTHSMKAKRAERVKTKTL